MSIPEDDAFVSAYLTPAFHEELQAVETPDAADVGEALEISIEEAVFLALQNNRSLRAQKLQPLIAGTFAEIERARFDAGLYGEISASRERTERFPDELDEPITDLRESQRTSIGIQQTLPTGTEIDAGLSHQLTESDRVEQSQHRVRAGLSLTQALMQGRGSDVNLIQLQRARLNERASQYEFRAFAEALTAEVETAYWDHVLAKRELEIFEASTQLARRQLEAMRERIELGQTAGVDINAAEAEVALRQQALIDARSTADTLRLRLIRLLNPGGGSAGIWGLEIETLDEPSMPEGELDPVTHHARAALRWRPEISEARLRLARRELEVVHTRNGALPKLDFFMTLGKTGFSDSFGQSVSNLDGDGYDATIGLRGDLPLGNRENRARLLQSELDLEEAEESIFNLVQLVELDVRSAYNEVLRAREQIQASAVTRQFQERLLETETEKFTTGLATALDVAQVQRDLLNSQIAEVKAAVDYRKALVALYRLEGTLLRRRGIAEPFPEPLSPE
ncbi:MAG: TolC family protein [Verrucomicrobia bacterium]|nr:TolC family protein [Verrucomicrobiota bacterium]MCH8514068.1 TolC family protein [Kiritimatiellia bacterium]